MLNSKKTASILAKIEDNIIWKILTCIILSFIIIVFFLIFNKAIDRSLFRKYKIINDVKIVSSIEDIYFENDKIVFNGYAFISDRHSKDDSISLFLYNVDTKEEIWFNAEKKNRPDVSKYFESEYNYDNSGFIAFADSKKIKKDVTYEVIINIDYPDANNETFKKTSRRTVSTNRFLLNGKLYHYNPNEFDKPRTDIKSDLLKEVFDKGYLCFYNKDIGLYLYQYNRKLYWIAKDDFEFEQSGNTFIIFRLYTTQVDKLPEKRIKHKFDNLDFIFEQYEFKDEITTPYRVAIREIPQDYIITNVKVGVYDTVNNNYIWSSNFHIDNKSNKLKVESGD